MALGLTIGGWFASAIITKLISMVFSYIGDQYEWQTGMKDRLKKLEDALPQIQAVVVAAERGLIKDMNPALDAWLWQLRDAADEADDVLDELVYQHMDEELTAGGNKVRYALFLSNRFAKRTIKQDPTLKRLKKIVKRLDQVSSRVGDFLKLIDNSAMKQQQQQPEISNSRTTSSFLAVESEVFGRDRERKEVVGQLLMPDPPSFKNNFSILPIVGIGGVGKTTLAQFVYNDGRVEEHFQLRMWVCVSDNFDVTIITRKILESASKESFALENFDTLQEMLKEKLKQKKFLLVLDDVWNDSDKNSWLKLLAPFKYGPKGSKILLTTRMETVTRIIPGTMNSIVLEGLLDHDYWLLFKECAFGDEDPDDHKKLQRIGKEIAKKLKGLPLAAKTVGGLLCSHLNDCYWTSILESDILNLKQEKNDLMPVLELSYQHLPADLQPCFAYCAIFPQDYEFERDRLVYMWMAVGFLPQPENGERWEDAGGRYFDGLVKRSFLELRKTKHRIYYVMHDLLHDLARSVSSGACLRIVGDRPSDIPKTLRHLSITTDDLILLENVSKLKSLRTLSLCFPEHSSSSFTSFENTLQKLLSELKSIRILELSFRQMKLFPDAISKLIHLRYLDLGRTRITRFPASFCRLYHLQVMYLGLKSPKLPEGMNNLINLRHLSAATGQTLEVFQIGKLTSLQELTFRVKMENGYKIGELKHMRELHQLRIENIDNIQHREEATEANLKGKEHLRSLWLSWGLVTIGPDDEPRDLNGSPDKDTQILDCLQPHSGLKELTISSYRGSRSPTWMRANFPVNLEYICIQYCEGWKDLPPLGQLPFLKTLLLIDLDAVQQIGPHFHGGGSVNAFPSLKELKFVGLFGWKDWSGWANRSQCFSRLSTLVIRDCPNLKEFPHLPLSLAKLKLVYVGSSSLPTLSGGPAAAAGMSQSSDSSGRISSLSSLFIDFCQNLTSLTEGLLQQQQLLTALEELTIVNCGGLAHLPVNGFRGLLSLKKLMIKNCPSLLPLMITDSLPPSLVKLHIEKCGDLDKSLPLLLQGLTSLSDLQLRHCAHATSLPSADVLGTLMALQNLTIENCEQLTSLEGLEALNSLKSLKIEGCPKLIDAALATTEGEGGGGGFLLSPDSLSVDHPSFLLAFSVLRNITSLRFVTFTDCHGLTSLPPELEQWLMQNSSSIQELCFLDCLSLLSLPSCLESLSFLQILKLRSLCELQELPNLPTTLEELEIINCHQLNARCRTEVGEDWHKIVHIPKVTCEVRYTRF